MSDETLRAIGELMDSVRSPGSFATRGTASAENLALEVEGLGALHWPVTPTQARQLCAIASPARYGLGEQTLLDPNVRHTWEIPRDRITIDQDRWHRTLRPMLDALRVDLGLPPDCELSAELHSMLVYETGQFFRRHQDSEKSDGMIGTLVVTLPSARTGGELVVEHRGERVIDTGSPDELGFIAFYADCAHEVLPVTDGYRISMTYNLVASGRTTPTTDTSAVDSPVAALAARLREHFTTPVLASPWHRNRGPADQPPYQLVYLLDHQYSQRGFGWDQLKGADAARAGALAAAADSAACDTALALAETRDCFEYEDFEDEEWMYGRRRRWELVDGTWKVVDETWESVDGEDEPFGEADSDETGRPADHPDRLGPEELGEPSYSDTTLTWWLDRSGTAGSPIDLPVTGDEICTGTTRSLPQPFACETEGYMGNEGNSVDRWYRRAAIVVRPRKQPEDQPG